MPLLVGSALRWLGLRALVRVKTEQLREAAGERQYGVGRAGCAEKLPRKLRRRQKRDRQRSSCWGCWSKTVDWERSSRAPGGTRLSSLPALLLPQRSPRTSGAARSRTAWKCCREPRSSRTLADGDLEAPLRLKASRDGEGERDTEGDLLQMLAPSPAGHAAGSRKARGLLGLPGRPTLCAREDEHWETAVQRQQLQLPRAELTQQELAAAPAARHDHFARRLGGLLIRWRADRPLFEHHLPRWDRMREGRSERGGPGRRVPGLQNTKTTVPNDAWT